MDFEWDLAKELVNLEKHGINFLEATECFLEPQEFALTDSMHSASEGRYFWVGKSAKNRVLTIRYTRRGSVIRIIGAAHWRKFRNLYYERTKD